MGTNQRFHASDSYFLEHSSSLLSDAVRSGKITDKEAGFISEFIEEVSATSQISAIRRYKLVGTLIRVHAYHPGYTECTIEDVYKAISTIKSAPKGKSGKPITKNTISDYVRMVKRIFTWLVENGYSNIDPKKLAKIKVPHFDRNTISSEDILTIEEVNRIIEACTNTRDRAMVSVLYEGGFRIGEIGNLRWSDVTFTGNNATARTSEKTGKERFVPLFTSCPYLAQWKSDYPLPIDTNSFVFLTATTHKPLQYAGVKEQLRVLAKRAGVTKYIKPHLFRHSRITHLCQQGLNESYIKMMMWGDVSTDMLKVYLHITADDVKKEVAELNGISLPSKTEDLGRGFKPVQCPNCGTLNPPTKDHCLICGTALTDNGRNLDDKVIAIVRELMTNPVVMQEVALKMSAEKKETP